MRNNTRIPNTDPIIKTVYNKWKRDVKKRDGHQCQFPGCSSKKRLQVHHINRWADAPLLRFTVNNGITLCHLHHKFIFNKEEFYAYTFHQILINKLKNG